MKKIEFVNGQSPYLNDKNLNQLQDNMEEVSVPEGGIKGQVLMKASNTDNDVEWTTPTPVLDELTSDSSTSALSAKQGKELNEKIERHKIAVLTGTITTPAKDSESLTGEAIINYPTGFNRDNSIIIGLMSHNVSNQDKWTISTRLRDAMSYLLGNNCAVTLRENDIRVFSSKADAAASGDTITYKFVLMKIS